VSLRAADAAAATDITQVIAAVDWVAEHKNDNGLNIRVLNLSFGTDSRQLPKIDPLAHALERAWKQGIVVVVSAGNAGFNMQNGGPGLTNPARDPYVISVGASDPRGTTTVADDALATFSSSGVPGATGSKNPDLLAPGRSVASLRVPGSFLDDTFGATAQVGEDNFRGSGTSHAAAVISGAAALILQQRPTITPDQLKKLLTSTATALPAVKPEGQGKGEVNLAKALTTATPSTTQSYDTAPGPAPWKPPAAPPTWPTGSSWAARPTSPGPRSTPPPWPTSGCRAACGRAAAGAGGCGPGQLGRAHVVRGRLVRPDVVRGRLVQRRLVLATSPSSGRGGERFPPRPLCSGYSGRSGRADILAASCIWPVR
jgi:subtilisin family serine protease